MIVLDEQLLGRGIASEIARWYRGRVIYITELRPGSVIKDDAIPGLLRELNGATFVTINVRDFWRKMTADKAYCVVCFGFSDSQAVKIPQALRDLFRLPGFATKQKRMGKVVRRTETKTSYYSSTRSQIENL